MQIKMKIVRKFRDFRIIAMFLVGLIKESSSSDKDQSKECLKFSAHKFIDSLNVYPNLNFKAKWTRDYKHFWKSTDFDFEARYMNETKRNQKSSKVLPAAASSPRVKVFLLPFSHNDPGWKKTYEAYFYLLTKKILTNAVTKMSEYKNMTFAWSEVSFLSKWWDEASFSQKETLKRLVKEGRFELLTGGWVMPDEATTTLFALVNQLVEGHQWTKKHLNIYPRSAWSLDAFGHGSTMPYLLKKAGIEGMMIQRVHYAWKHWFAEHQEGDFLWAPRWSSRKSLDGILCHNLHYDLYPTKHSCGPSPNVCMKFDFRLLEGARDEHIPHVQQVNDKNIHNLADMLAEQYGRTASLTKHKNVITTLGGDFRFESALEWEQQYNNYKQLFEYINSRSNTCHTSVQFGTLADYFKAVVESNVTLSTFSGDLFPYIDVIFPFAPGHWTGYYGTRPFWKKLCREAEDELLKAEILFTFSFNVLRQRNHSTEVLSRNYDNLVYARRSIALFQHHDGITGTSPRATMLDYARKLTQAWNFCRHIQRLAIEHIWRRHLNIVVPPLVMENARKSYTAPAQQITVKLYENANIEKKIVIFNSLAWERSHLVRLRVQVQNLAVRAPDGQAVVAQVNVVPRNNKLNNDSSFADHHYYYELLFIAQLPPLSVVTYSIYHLNGDSTTTTSSGSSGTTTNRHYYSADAAVHGTISCKNCNNEDHDDDGIVHPIKGSEITLNNGKISAHFDANLGLLTRIQDKSQANMVKANVTLSFGRYDAIYGSGAYLLHPFTSSMHSLINSDDISIYLIRGPITSEIIVITPTLKLKSWILHTGSPEAMSAVYMSNQVNGTLSDSALGEYFMRFQTDLNNTESEYTSSTFQQQTNNNAAAFEKPSPVLFTDTNGLAVEKRVTLSKLPYQANHFPITHFTFIQDPIKNIRLSLLVDRSHGVSSMIRGRLETIFDRRLRYDDARGMEEGVMDFEDHVSNYIIKLEQMMIPLPLPLPLVQQQQQKQNANFDISWEPSLAIQKLSKCLNHQPTIFLYDAWDTHKSGHAFLFSQQFPDDVHLLNLQTLSGLENSEDIKSVPSTKALMILQRIGHNKNTKPLSLAPLSTGAKECSSSNNNQEHYYSDDNDNGTKLNSTILINHSVKRTNLVGTVELNDNTSSGTTPTTKSLIVGRPHELSAFLINF